MKMHQFYDSFFPEIMPYCCVVGCQSGGRKDPNKKHQWYQLPKSPKMRKLWLDMINREFIPSDKTKVCERHFREDDFRYSTKKGRPAQRKNLLNSAFPSLFLNGSKNFIKNRIEMNKEVNIKTKLDNKKNPIKVKCEQNVIDTYSSQESIEVKSEQESFGINTELADIPKPCLPSNAEEFEKVVKEACLEEAKFENAGAGESYASKGRIASVVYPYALYICAGFEDRANLTKRHYCAFEENVINTKINTVRP